mmetsp:Transcript_63756/g.120699  ORF Transcript_63756/g.120699 Transcript_63756/m.120699 type:complete len:371 (+) Transcript_63756:100-1212(+)
MTFLGHASRRTEEPPIPQYLGDDVTQVQKKRLALLAKMGLGPNMKSGGAQVRAPSPPKPAALEDASRGPPSLHDRKAALLERERRVREQEEKEREQEEKEERERRAKKRSVGLRPLGPVQPREETLTPTPITMAIREPPKSSPKSHKMELKISADTAERARGISSAGASASDSAAMPSAPEADDSEEDMEVWALAALRAAKQPPVKKPPPPAPVQAEPKKKGKKRKRRRKDDDEDEDGDDDDLEDDEEDAAASLPTTALAQATAKQVRAENPYKKMVVDSVKGKVSNAYKGFTDADLERRFGFSQAGSGGGLMSEEQVLAMINKEKREKNPVAAARRIQREQAEWIEERAKHAARESQKNRERLVVSARK